MEPTSADRGPPLPGSIRPQEHTWQWAEARKHLPNSLLKTASLQGTIPTHSENTSCSATPQTAACADLSGFQIYGLLFSYIPHILPQCWVIKCNLSNFLLSKLCNYWRTEFLWVPTSWLVRKHSAMRYQFSGGENTKKTFKKFGQCPKKHALTFGQAVGLDDPCRSFPTAIFYSILF